QKQPEEVIAVDMTAEEILNTDFTAYIMKFAGFGQEDIVKCKTLLKHYGVVAESGDTSNDAQRVRKELTALFYDIYEKAFFRTVKEKRVDSVLELFFQFGILDTALAGKDHVAELVPVLAQLKKQLKIQQEQIAKGEMHVHVYTIYQWLCMIYKGEKEPSKNEFDVDYNGDLLEQRKQHRITREQENALKHDQDKKVQFEIANIFRSTNRATSGRISTFCPIFHEKEFIRDAQQMLITVAKAEKVINDIRAIDYSCFYREVFFVDPAHGIDRAQIMKEVLPELILMPNIGGRAMMWQETAGVKRDTQARFIFPIMTASDLSQMMLETVGRYRWEICRKIMGVHWNDIREKSLTSEFYDYIQFYRKNRDLSAVAKEKVKADLVHAKNNYREVFVMDYVGWMKYESQGSFRLNKVSRKIISDYVPFAKGIRAKLTDNPMFRELFAQSEILRRRKKDKEKLLFDRYQDAGGTITPELETHLQFFEM
ncbi:MAG: cyclic nucleotide-binding domain-containing protein, partial [Lachnospiraceae bacterium]|nr:cyclic nucleotide-binding domain-containing protein [Lachnospiraceae bacterium]